jgi:DEAD/DEAH box helicase domain-containing protein
MSPRELLKALQEAPEYRGQIAACRVFPARQARFANLEQPLPAALTEPLAAHGVARFYTHQARAIDLARAGASVVTTTATASGKTLTYNVPVAERLLSDPEARALYLYPTKALAQDQLGKLDAFGLFTTLRPATYDGDTPRHLRPAIRRTARIVLSNPDMLHTSVLPNHAQWADFLAGLAFVVVDEVHAYRGVFGSHVANVLRRLRRLCDHYGSRPQILATSATLADPGAHFRTLTGVEPEVVSEDGAPQGERAFAIWNPPLLSEESGERRSANSEAVELFCDFVRGGLRTIAFTRARVIAELIVRRARERLSAGSGDLANRIAVYRAGYTPEQRREIEQRLFRGELLAVAATNALELGIDVGTLDACLLVGYPGTAASVRQQAGRAGRARQEALAVMVALGDPLDQFFVRSPEALFDAPLEQATLDPENLHVLARHLACAAYERSLGPEDAGWFGPSTLPVAAALMGEGALESTATPEGVRFRWAGGGYPSADVSIRSAGGRPFEIFDVSRRGALLGTVDDERALQVLYPGAIYLHQGESFRVEALKVEQRAALVRPAEPDYYTAPQVTTEVRVERERSTRSLGAVLLRMGDASVTTRVLGYRKVSLASEKVLERVPLELPARSYTTVAAWLGLPAELVEQVAPQELPGALHAVEHAVAALAPLFAMCDRWDVGGTSHPHHPDLSAPALFLYDAEPGGVGIAERCFEAAGELLQRARETVEGCPCDDGCPACIHSARCGSGNEPLSKPGAILLLRGLLGSDS